VLRKNLEYSFVVLMG